MHPTCNVQADPILRYIGGMSYYSYSRDLAITEAPRVPESQGGMSVFTQDFGSLSPGKGHQLAGVTVGPSGKAVSIIKIAACLPGQCIEFQHIEGSRCFASRVWY